MHKIIGSDGKTYGPASTATLREWLQAGRVDLRTPVLPEGATEWTFLGLLPEFSQEATGTPPVITPPRSARRTNGFATAGFVCGLISLICCCGCPFNLLGIIFSIIAMAQIRGQTVKEDGWGLAVAGLACSILSLLAGLGMALLNVAFSPASFLWKTGVL